MGSNRRIQTEETSRLPHNTAKQLSTCPSALEPTSLPCASVPRPSRHPLRPQGCAGRFKRPNQPALSPALSPHHRRFSRRRRRTACPRSCTQAALRTASCSFPLPCERIKRQRRSGRTVDRRSSRGGNNICGRVGASGGVSSTHAYHTERYLKCGAVNLPQGIYHETREKAKIFSRRRLLTTKSLQELLFPLSESTSWEEGTVNPVWRCWLRFNMRR